MRAITIVWTLGVLTAYAEEAHPPRRDITIETYNLAHIEPKILAQAEQLAASVFATAGVNIRWMTGPSSDTAHLINDFSAADGKQCAADLPLTLVRIQFLPHAPSGFFPKALGYALPCAKQGMQATLYVDHMEAVSYRQSAALYRVLGYALAHETGHVILKSSAHDRSGLMKAVWTKADWQRAAVMIPFTPNQGRPIADRPQ